MNPSYIIIPIITFAVAFIGGSLTNAGMPWYETLNLPEYTSSGAIIGSIWAVIFIFTTICVLFIWNRFNRDDNFWQTIGLLVVNAALNVVWTYVFFGIHAIKTAIVVAVLLELNIVWLIFKIRPASKKISLLLYPYAIWVLFAIFLTYSVWRLNG